MKSRPFAESISRVGDLTLSENYWRITFPYFIEFHAREQRKTNILPRRTRSLRGGKPKDWDVRQDEKEQTRKGPRVEEHNKIAIKSYRAAPRNVRRYHLRGLHASLLF